MSVIFGKCNFNGEILAATDLELMQQRLNHWSADQSAVFKATSWGLGHLMLFNTPQSLVETLPYHNKAAQLTISADARLDNQDELITRLELKDTSNHLVPDSLLILKAYQKYGKSCVDYLIGDFAFAIYDGEAQQLFCARDHLGVKPFFYYLDQHYFAFASEKKGILTLPGVNQAVNKQFLFNQLMYPAEQTAEDTLYEHIKRLKPAHILTINLAKKRVQLQRYWEPDVETELKPGNRTDYYEGLRYHFEQAVQCRTVSAYPLGAELSGGLDSSAITGAAQSLRLQNQPLFTLSNTLHQRAAITEGKELDERRYIDTVVQHFGIQNSIYVTQPAFEHIIEEYQFSVEVNDGLEKWNPLWQLGLKKAAKEHNIRTLLSGFPGDELVTYRGKYYFLDYLDKRQYLRYALAKKRYPGFNKLEPFLPIALRHAIAKSKRALHIYDERAKKTFAAYNIPDHYKKHMRDSLWLDPYFREQFKSYRHFQRYRILKPQVSQRMESETRYGIYFRTEPRFPMADIRLIQYYLSMPNELKYEGELTRTAYRQAIGKYLPPLIAKRDDKFGSVAPYLMAQDKRGAGELFSLVKQLPDLHFLKKNFYLNNLKQAANASYHKSQAVVPAIDTMLWIIQHQELLKGL